MDLNWTTGNTGNYVSIEMITLRDCARLILARLESDLDENSIEFTHVQDTVVYVLNEHLKQAPYKERDEFSTESGRPCHRMG